MAYLLGAGVLLSRLAIGAARTDALVRTARYHEGHWTSPSCAAPVTVGWLQPIVILPVGWPEWPAAQLAVVLAHEQEHARRRDPLMQFLALLNRALFWFHPLAWWLERRLSALAEEACDAAVLERGHDPYDYSCYLLEMARTVERSGVRIKVLGMAMPGSSLPQRIRQILSAHPVPRMTRARTLSAATACVLLSSAFAVGALDRARPQVVAMRPMVAAVQPVPAQAPAPAPQPQRGRQLVLFFDTAVMDAADQARAASAAQKFVGTQMQSGDKAAIMIYDGGVKIRQDFTDDHDRFLQALAQLPDGHSAQQDPDRLMDGLRDAVRLLEPIAGKKQLIYFARPAARPSGDTAMKDLIDAAMRANVAFYPIDISAPREPVPAPAFDAASVKLAPPAGGRGGGLTSVVIPDPTRVTGRHVTLRQAIQFAYNVHPYQISGVDWRGQDSYDIEARPAGAATPDQLRQMMQTLLAERFHLALHRETKVLPVYEMTVAKGGPKMPEVKEGETGAGAGQRPGFFFVGTAGDFADAIGVDMPVVDKTGLTGKYHFDVTIEPGQDLLAALQEQFGLKFTPKKDPIEVLVIDHVEKIPTEN
jgi:uncharacterized protein (TIGR03435 family)